MGQVINLAEYKQSIKEKEENILFLKPENTLSWAKAYLGKELYEQASKLWSLEELKKTMHQAQIYPTYAFEAYEIIFKSRKN